MKLIVGLGNPGRSYAGNRHNIGFMCASYFARKSGIKLDRKQALARIGSGKAAGNEVAVARPQTFMNASGKSVSRLMQKFKVDINDLFVIHDDLDLPLGKIRIRQGGGSGGHKGIDSITGELGSPDFTRIRIGIGRPDAEASEDEVISYVLSDFTPEQKKVITKAIPRVTEAILCLITEGLTAAMNEYN